MTTTLTTDEAVRLVQQELLRIAPDADLASLPADAPFRQVLELDSLDFLSLVEALADRAGIRIDEEDYDQLETLEGSAAYLVRRASHPDTVR
ncbi:acyl carrier protein [Streptomyces sp. ODS28]|uniref:acyl carrier protein n=1 Tax=Streptomyces sp. ODS28 TaxID=3136688 RepID=UPI0031E8329B